MAFFVSVFMQDSLEYSGNNSDPRDYGWREGAMQREEM